MLLQIKEAVQTKPIDSAQRRFLQEMFIYAFNNTNIHQYLNRVTSCIFSIITMMNTVLLRPSDTVPSKKAVANTSGLRLGHQSTWKAQLLAEGSYVTRDQRQRVGYKRLTSSSPITSEVWGFQHRARSSLPQESSKSASCLHHERDRPPFCVRLVSIMSFCLIKGPTGPRAPLRPEPRP